jgi:phosphoribosylformimino-5-aminoimidazole carboxamide ribotide isomerase
VEIIPAIDLRGERVVRLRQGDFDQQTTFSDDPIGVARSFVEAGATRIHVVDLDGALDGSPSQRVLCRSIAASISVPIEVGGGMRTAEEVALALVFGIDRIVIGTAAVEHPDMVAEVLSAHGAERIAVGLDARDGIVAISGWTKGSDVPATELMTSMAVAGVRRFIYTDIARDGTLTSPNFDSVRNMVTHAAALGPDVRVIASGGIGELDHLKRLAELRVEGAIVGSAIYKGTVDLAEAIAAIK